MEIDTLRHEIIKSRIPVKNSTSETGEITKEEVQSFLANYQKTLSTLTRSSTDTNNLLSVENDIDKMISAITQAHQGKDLQYNTLPKNEQKFLDSILLFTLIRSCPQKAMQGSNGLIKV